MLDTDDIKQLCAGKEFDVDLHLCQTFVALLMMIVINIVTER